MLPHAIASASAARPSAVWRDVKVVPGEGVTMLAVTPGALVVGETTRGNAASPVLGGGDGFQVPRVHASSVPAQVVHLLVRGDVTYEQPVSGSVRGYALVGAPAEHAVASRGVPTKPFPASETTNDLALKARHAVHRNMVTRGGDSHR
jgi:hypothetical protein